MHAPLIHMLWKMNAFCNLNIFSCIILRVYLSLHSTHVICWLVLTVSEHLHVRLVQKSFWICCFVCVCGWLELHITMSAKHTAPSSEKEDWNSACSLPTPSNKRKQLFMSSHRAKDTHLHAIKKIYIYQFVSEKSFAFISLLSLNQIWKCLSSYNCIITITVFFCSYYTVITTNIILLFL